MPTVAKSKAPHFMIVDIVVDRAGISGLTEKQECSTSSDTVGVFELLQLPLTAKSSQDIRSSSPTIADIFPSV